MGRSSSHNSSMAARDRVTRQTTPPSKPTAAPPVQGSSAVPAPLPTDLEASGRSARRSVLLNYIGAALQSIQGIPDEQTPTRPTGTTNTPRPESDESKVEMQNFVKTEQHMSAEQIFRLLLVKRPGTAVEIYEAFREAKRFSRMETLIALKSASGVTAVDFLGAMLSDARQTKHDIQAYLRGEHANARKALDETELLMQSSVAQDIECSGWAAIIEMEDALWSDITFGDGKSSSRYLWSVYDEVIRTLEYHHGRGYVPIRQILP
ncbi:hypothetical protein M231_03566 [Tremella mesenterica]|uniref:Uncharacterized protein n=1 Tax=Tremella mesenterica TaxID=5217 RepID=A0A4Q1BMY7_TREME|nr:hypothetical protein M231_03566 [Tremella mesenterica]